jgi:hypothetical protein
MDFFAAVAGARSHVIEFIVLAIVWDTVKYSAPGAFVRHLLYSFGISDGPLSTLLNVTAVVGLLSFPAGWLGVSGLFNTLASVVVIAVWGSVIVRALWAVARFLLIIVESPLGAKYAAPLRGIISAFRDGYESGRKRSHGRREQGQQEGRQDRQSRSDGQDRQQRGERETRSAGALTRKQALEILELQEGSAREQVNAAYKRLMQRVHPDMGGSNYFAKQLNAARELLLSELQTAA